MKFLFINFLSCSAQLILVEKFLYIGSQHLIFPCVYSFDDYD